ncbi:MAG: hypothetical protein WA086_15115, partial [Ideonella sp.]
QRVQRGIVQQLARLGVEAPLHASPAALADLVSARLGVSAAPVAEQLQQLQALRYAPQPPVTELQAWLRHFKHRCADARRQIRQGRSTPQTGHHRHP